MTLPGKKVRFLVDYSPLGRTSTGPHYAKGEVYDLELSYADKYIRLGKAEDVVAQSPVVDDAVKASEEVSEIITDLVEQTAPQASQSTQHRRGNRRG